MQDVEGSLNTQDGVQRSAGPSDAEQHEDYSEGLQEVEVGRAGRVVERLVDPVVACDEPAEGSVVTRDTLVSGWAYSPAGIRGVSLWLEGQRVGQAKLGLKRPDVAQDHPEWEGALHSGFRYRFDVAPTLAEERAELVVVAEDERGRQAEVRRVVRRVPGQLLKEQLKSKKQQLRSIRTEAAVETDEAELAEHKKRKKSVQQEILQLDRELRAAEEGWTEGEEQTGALPDFIIIGAKRCGQTTLYNLLTQHPHVEPAASQELHFFDRHFDLGVEWYRQCFPAPRFKEGRETITGEGTPRYLVAEHVPERVKKVVPQARLIALLRNPVDRIYADYRKREVKGRESVTFEEVIEEKMESALRGEGDEMLEGEHRADPSVEEVRLLPRGVYRRGVYVDHLLRWSEFFPKEQLLVLKSEEFFEYPKETLKSVIDFLDLPEWEPEAWLLQKIRDEAEETRLHPETRRRLEEYFEPHNKRLYEYLGRDFGW